MLFKPQEPIIAKHIDYYWIVDNASTTVLANTSHLYAYPGVTPDLLIVLDGYYEFEYQEQSVKQCQSMLFSFLHNQATLNLSKLNSFILVKFKSRALGSLQPFVNQSTTEIMQNPIGFSESAFGGSISKLAERLKGLSENETVLFLDHWFLSHYKKEREGFVVEMAEDVSPKFDLQEIMAATKYSYATIERHFKREMGLTPKRYQALRRCKEAVSEMCATKNDDWLHYVSSYGYYDQAHFIKDVKRNTKFTPSQLIAIPSFVTLRPKL